MKTNGNDSIQWIPGIEEIGLTKREYFAALNMQGMLASWSEHDLTHFSDFAHDAVMASDALIEALNKE